MNKILFFVFKNLALVLNGTGLGKIPYAMNIYFILNKRLSPKYVEIDSIKYFLDNQDSLGLSVFGVNDEKQGDLIKKIISKNWNVIDVGAHIGYYSMQYAKLVGDGGSVFSFEPSKETYKILVSNIKLNNFRNVFPENLIVSNKLKKVKFFLSGNPLTNRIASKHVEGNYYYVQSIRLDDYFKDFKKPINFVKIDVEGAEFEVLQGMKTILKENQDIKLIIEFCPSHLEEYATQPSELLDFLINFGFTFYDISGQKRIKKISKELLLQKYKTSITNILCLR